MRHVHPPGPSELQGSKEEQETSSPTPISTWGKHALNGGHENQFGEGSANDGSHEVDAIPTLLKTSNTNGTPMGETFLD